MRKRTKVLMISSLAVLVLAILGIRFIGRKPVENFAEDLQAFCKVLWDAYQKGILPDGQVLENDVYQQIGSALAILVNRVCLSNIGKCM